MLTTSVSAQHTNTRTHTHVHTKLERYALNECDLKKRLQLVVHTPAPAQLTRAQTSTQSQIRPISILVTQHIILRVILNQDGLEQFKQTVHD